MWIVNNFPAYAMVFGWSTRGYMACPIHKDDVTSGWHAGKSLLPCSSIYGCQGTTSGGKRIKSSIEKQSIVSNLENGSTIKF